VENLKASLECAAEKEETLRKALEIKEEHSEHLENLFKTEMEKLKSSNETKLQVTIEELEARQKEVKVLREKVKRMESEIEIESKTVDNSNEQIEMMKKELQENRKHYEGKPVVHRQ
jgi:hypothetical protein